MTKDFITAKEISQSLGISESKAYQIVRKLNDELHSKGYITIAGRCPRAFFNEKWYGGIVNG